MSIPALILAGGLGTRLKHLIPELPKPMAPVAHKPFLYHILKHLQCQGIKEVYLSVGYKSEKIQNYFHEHFHNIQLHYIHEDEPLGTGGAIAHALKQIPSNNVLVMNGDTFLNINLSEFIKAHNNENITLALKKVFQSNRYGFVELNNHYITQFSEKSEKNRDGYINAGVYLINTSFFLSHMPSTKVFSFEKDFLEIIFLQHKIKTHITNNYFIDIGIPEDYQRAQTDFSKLKHLEISKQWTLFLDRDGVLNKKLENDYVKTTQQFQLIENVLPALKKLRKIFGRIIIVTNQQGIGKQLMTDEDLNNIHQHMLNIFKTENIYIDKIYYAPQLASTKSIMRKPNIGMALKAKEDFSDISFSQSIMIGDSLSDIQFAQNAGMYSIYLSENPEHFFPYDFVFKDLFEFSKCFDE